MIGLKLKPRYTKKGYRPWNKSKMTNQVMPRDPPTWITTDFLFVRLSFHQESRIKNGCHREKLKSQCRE